MVKGNGQVVGEQKGGTWNGMIGMLLNYVKKYSRLINFLICIIINFISTLDCRCDRGACLYNRCNFFKKLCFFLILDSFT